MIILLDMGVSSERFWMVSYVLFAAFIGTITIVYLIFKFISWIINKMSGE